MNRTDSRITSACSEPITLSTACAAVILPSSAIVVLLLRQSLRGDRRFEAPRWPTFFKTSPKALLHHFYRLDPSPSREYYPDATSAASSPRIRPPRPAS